MLLIKNLPKQIQIINKCLQKEGVICFPTETVYALASDATKPNAVDKVYKIKNRSRKKLFSILMHDIKTAKKYARVNNQALVLMKKFSPGPITYVLPNKHLPNWPKNLGIRIPSHPIAQFILSHYPNPVVGSSVNISGQKSAKTSNEIPDVIKNKVDIIIADTSGTHVSGIDSTIVDLSVPKHSTIIREGEINTADINKICNISS